MIIVPTIAILYARKNILESNVGCSSLFQLPEGLVYVVVKFSKVCPDRLLSLSIVVLWELRVGQSGCTHPKSMHARTHAHIQYILVQTLWASLQEYSPPSLPPDYTLQHTLFTKCTA